MGSGRRGRPGTGRKGRRGGRRGRGFAIVALGVVLAPVAGAVLMLVFVLVLGAMGFTIGVLDHLGGGGAAP